MAQEFDLGSVKGIQGERGLTGPAGPTGPPGPTPHITVGETLTLPVGSAATVSRRASSPDGAPILDFAIPGGGSGDMLSQVYDPQNLHQDMFAYVEGKSGKRGATVVVAASDSRDGNRADYQCSGENDQLVLRTAINALPSVGGKLLLLEGTYHLGSYGVTPVDNVYRILSVSNAKVTIMGQGDATVLRLMDNVGAAGQTYCLIYAASAGFRLRDLLIDGNSGGNSAGAVEGLRLTWNSENSDITNCRVVNCRACAIDSEAKQVSIHGNRIVACGDGLRLLGGTDLVYANCIDGCSNYGITSDGGEHGVTANRVSGSGAIGIYLQGGSNHRLCGNFLCDQPKGIRLYLASYARIQDNDIRRTWSGGSYGDGEYSLHLLSCQYCLVLGNRSPGKAYTLESCTTIVVYLSSTDWNLAF